MNFCAEGLKKSSLLVLILMPGRKNVGQILTFVGRKIVTGFLDVFFLYMIMKSVFGYNLDCT